MRISTCRPLIVCSRLSNAIQRCKDCHSLATVHLTSVNRMLGLYIHIDSAFPYCLSPGYNIPGLTIIARGPCNMEIQSMPSYAAPTEASTRRSQQQPTAKAVVATKLLITGGPRREALRSFALSTQSSLQKDLSQCRFPLFDLPPELRDKIYQSISASWPDTKLYLAELAPTTAVKVAYIRTALLRASGRLRDEAVAYFLRDREFDIAFYSEDVQWILDWLERVGRQSMIQLCSNSNVTI